MALTRIGVPTGPLKNRFLDRVDRQGPNHCWPWTGAKSTGGAGTIMSDRGAHLSAHHVAYQQAYGVKTKGFYVAHTCKDKLCMNPAHLVLQTPKEHPHANRSKTHCKRGHSLNATNARHSKGRRRCKRCHILLLQRSKLKKVLDIQEKREASHDSVV